MLEQEKRTIYAEKKDKDEKTKHPQIIDKQNITNKIFAKWQRMSNENRNQFSYFRQRNIIDYINDGNSRVNNYRVKPEWKEPWQSNISDITTHAKLMAIVAQVQVNRSTPKYKSRFKRDIYSKIKAEIVNNVYQYISKTERNGDVDDLFTLIRAAREGTSLQFINFSQQEELGMDIRFIPLDEAYFGDMKKFHMKDQNLFAWRFTMDYDDFLSTHDSKQYQDIDKVKAAGQIIGQDTEVFKISQGLEPNQVEKIIWFDKSSNQFAITANSILITPIDYKLTDFRGDRKIPIAKCVYEPYNDNFVFGRSLPDILKDNQDAIDFLFNAMFDKEMLSVMRPILVGGNNNLDDNFWYPGGVHEVADVSNIKEMVYEGPDMNAFRVLKELQDRQHFASIDPTQQGIALGKKTATADLLAQEAAKKVFALFSTMFNDFQKQKMELMQYDIYKYYIKDDKYKPFLVENVRLADNSFGDRRIEITSKLPTRNEFGTSPELFAENALIEGNTEIVKMSEKDFKDFDIKVEMDVQESEAPRGALKKSLDERFAAVAFQRPDLYDQRKVGEKFAEALHQDPSEVMVKENSPQEKEAQMTKELEGSSEVPSLQNLASKINV